MTIEYRNGHAPGHVRDTFLAAVEAFYGWRHDAPEPVVDYDVDDGPRPITLSKACSLVWNCTDIIPGYAFELLRHDLPIKRQTYAACARAMKIAVRTQAI